MNLLCLDFETKDPYIRLGLGAGWVYKIHVENSTFKVLGYSLCWITNHIKAPSYHRISELDYLKHSLDQADGVIMHNAQYDLGCLRALGIEIKNLKVYDTKIIAQLYDNNLQSYSLDNLSKLYLPQDQQKKKSSLADSVKKHHLLRTPGGRDPDENAATYMQRAAKFAIENMDVMQEVDFAAVAEYANYDTIATANLFLKYIETISLEQAEYWSSIQKICVKLRERGVKIDLNVIRSNLPLLEKDIDDVWQQIRTHMHPSFTKLQLDSPKQLTNILNDKGYRLPISKKGNDSSDSKWMAEQNDPLLTLIVEYRTLTLLHRDYFVKPLNFQEYTCPEAMCGERYGRVYPEYNLFGAITGRFSSSSPNIQQIPKRNKKWGAICRSMFVPDDPNKQWHSLDWSNQEGRLQLHYALLINATGAQELVDKFHENPSLDLHQTVADLAKIARNAAKAVNLGLSYGMGKEKLMKSLKLPLKQAESVLRQYYEALPFLNQLTTEAQRRLKTYGHIKTIGGRLARREKPVIMPDGRVWELDYKALNKLIQGSGADFMYACLIEADKAGLDIMAIVHDEFCIEGTIKDALEMKSIMENTIKISVPMVAEIHSGKSWSMKEE
jgi:DNA polymerase I-like protein with 3'-5' exonuclease and polymerase domains